MGASWNDSGGIWPEGSTKNWPQLAQLLKQRL
jgi:arabinogalactan endo-1,4-beta-galactosidase